MTVDRSHPITRWLPRSFTLRDEYYTFAERPEGRVLLRAGSLPLAWVRGRRFYCALGHEPATWRDRTHRRLMRQAVAWVA